MLKTNEEVLCLIDKCTQKYLGVAYDMYMSLMGKVKVNDVYIEDCLNCDVCTDNCEVNYFKLVTIANRLYLAESSADGVLFDEEFVIPLSYRSLNSMCESELSVLFMDLGKSIKGSNR